MSAREYNGHHCWNCWNVALWIGNDEGLYRAALECKRAPRFATWLFVHRVVGVGARTPDGARYTYRAVKAALAGLDE